MTKNSHLFVNAITNIDVSILCPRRAIIGQSWIVDFSISAPLDDQGMVWDFSKVKPAIKKALDNKLDHTLLVPSKHHNIKINNSDDCIKIEFTLEDDSYKIIHNSPKHAVTMIESKEITMSVVANEARKIVKDILPDKASSFELDFREEHIDGFWYCYSHGLKKHDGACQRIAHGHRSAIKIWVNGKRSSEWERWWARQWQDVYLANREDMIGGGIENGKAVIEFKYQASEGEYNLQLPESCCYLLDSDTTIEHISEHIASETKAMIGQNSHVRVQAFEGINKGSISEK